MRGIRTRTRLGWVKKVLGGRRRFTFPGFERALSEMQARGWNTPMPAIGPVFEKVAMVHRGHPLAAVISQYLSGGRTFDRATIESILGARLDTLRGARLLAKAGFGVLRCNGTQVELLAADPDEALLVNEARHHRALRGYSLRHVVGSVLHIRRPGTARVNLTDDRRLMAFDELQTKWGIRCDDLLSMRRRARLVSDWIFNQVTA